MYQLLPFVSAYTTVLPNLPVEIWCIILKLLDYASLLTTIRTFPFLYSIAQGDSALRRMVKDATKEEQKQIFAQWTQPGMKTRVSRKDYARLFSTNVSKVASTIKRQRVGNRAGEEKVSRKATASGVGPIKTSKRTRFNPYRL